jgi:osmotically-inducible protein OsmY
MNTRRTNPSLPRALVLAALLAASANTLTACVPLVAVGGIAAGAMVISDRRTIGTQTEDEQIELKVAGNIGAQIKESGGIGVVSFNRKVLLYGQVLAPEARRLAEQIASSADNVRSVQNELQVTGRASVGTTANDTTLTAKVKTAFVDARDLQSNAFKVVTEAGIVYLMGIVTRAEGDRAASVASRVSGVRKVVTVFDYVTEEELARIMSTEENKAREQQAAPPR